MFCAQYLKTINTRLTITYLETWSGRNVFMLDNHQPISNSLKLFSDHVAQHHLTEPKDTSHIITLVRAHGDDNDTSHIITLVRAHGDDNDTSHIITLVRAHADANDTYHIITLVRAHADDNDTSHTITLVRAHADNKERQFLQHRKCSKLSSLSSLDHLILKTRKVYA